MGLERQQIEDEVNECLARIAELEEQAETARLIEEHRLMVDWDDYEQQWWVWTTSMAVVKAPKLAEAVRAAVKGGDDVVE